MRNFQGDDVAGKILERGIELTFKEGAITAVDRQNDQRSGSA